MRKQFRILVRTSAWYTIISLTGIFITGSISFFLIMFVAMSASFRILYPERNVNFFKKSKTQDLIVATALIFYAILRIVLTNGDFLVSFLESLLLFQAFKWISPLEAKDFFLLSGIAYIEVVASASLTSKVLFLPIFTLITVLTTITLFILFLNTETDFQTERRDNEITLRSHFITFLGGVGLVSLFITVIIFLSIPRLGVGFFSRKMMHREKIPGASGKIDLNMSTFSNLDRRVIARVRGEIIRGSPVYLKSITLSEFERDTWRKRSQRLRLIGAGTNPLSAERGRGSTDLRGDVFLEATGENMVPTLPYARAITWDVGKLYVDEEGDVRSIAPITYPVMYHLFIGETRGDDEQTTNHYTDSHDLPPSIRHIAKKLLPGTPGDGGVVSAITDYLQKNYRYELAPGKVSLDEFLSGEKKGNCQHFATSTVLLARAMGLPARLAGGYISSEFNDIGKYWMFRQRDAHAWAEVYLDDSGWTIVDSTPPGLSHFPSENSFNHVLDWIRQNWQEYVVGYDLKKQVKLSRELIVSSLQLSRNLRSTFRAGTRILILPLLILIIASAWLLILQSRGRRAIVRETPNTIYRQFLRPIIRDGRRRGILRKKSETPSEYMTRVKQQLELDSDTYHSFLTVYNRVRFGRSSPQDLSLLKNLTSKVRSSLKK